MHLGTKGTVPRVVAYAFEQGLVAKEIVSGQQLVGPLAREHGLHVLRRQAGKQQFGRPMPVHHRHFAVPERSHEMRCEPGLRNRHHVVVERVLLRRGGRPRRLVVVGIVKRDGERLHGAVGQSRGLRRDRRRVQPA